ncbi:MAG: hypothetical protein DWB43_04435 [Lautropia sp.]|nr:MAG: hypothetical protein EDM78_04105 [Pseudomonadota bacterium]MBC6958768.1 hypothetical protein [Lautropia sp.]RIK89400.1 MAG: hypothetical protein DCC70_08225 [Burkholderiales bacterium]
MPAGRRGGVPVNATPTSAREAATLAMLAKRKLRLTPFGRGWRIVGTGVDVLVTDWRRIHPDDLRPLRPRE